MPATMSATATSLAQTLRAQRPRLRVNRSSVACSLSHQKTKAAPSLIECASCRAVSNLSGDEGNQRESGSSSAQQQDAGRWTSTMGKEEDPKWARHRSQFNVDPFAEHPSSDHYSFPLVNAHQLADRARTESWPADNPRPRSVRMLARDFIDDSLYNPVYGYFSRHAVLLPDIATTATRDADGAPNVAPQPSSASSQRSGFAFSKFANDRDFSAAVEGRYLAFEDSLPLGPSSPPNRRAKPPPSTLSALGHSAASAQLARAKTVTQQGQSRPSAKHRVGSAEDLEERQKRGKEELERQAQAERDRQLGIKKDHEDSHEADVRAMAARQVWHTPTELFKPFYAQAVARYLCAEYKLTLYPYQDLVIYELGAGSGALAHDILAYLKDEEPDVFQRTRYVISEISERLSKQQKEKLRPFAGKVRVVNRNFLEWEDTVLEPCFVIALEDNLTHDVVRYSTSTLQPYQGLVSIDATGDMEDLYEPVRDPLILRYLQLSRAVRATAVPVSAPRHLTALPSSIRKVLSAHFPLYPNLTSPHYIPTGQLRLLDVLRSRFPQHRLIASDFHSLPDAIQGVDAPVVQTRLNGTMVPVTTFKVLQGFFDIFFPTNFQMLREVYTRVMSGQHATEHQADATASSSQSPLTSSANTNFRPDFFYSSGRAGRSRGQRVKIYTHAQFLEQYAEVEQTRLQDGSNPLLGWYQNASWILT